MGVPDGPVVYACPMHPEVTGEASDRCPKCGMKLLAVAAPSSYACPMHPEVVSETPDRCPKCGMKLVDAALVTSAGHSHEPHGHEQHEHQHHAHMAHGGEEHSAAHAMDHGDHAHDAGGIEWEDDMVEVNRLTTPANMRWKLVDRDTGAANHEIDWQFTVGDRVKLRLVNEMDSDHPMHHPFHVHGAGRFVVLARDGVPEANLVWKDTVLVRTGRDRRHPARRHEPRTVDGALPHRRAPRERDDVQLQRRARNGRVRRAPGLIYLLGRAATPGAAETRQFLLAQRCRVPLGRRRRRPAHAPALRRRGADRRPLPVRALPDGSMLRARAVHADEICRTSRRSPR